MASGNGNGHGLKGKMLERSEKMKGSQAWSSIFRPGSFFRKGYTDSPRNRSYVIMNSVLYHLHPVKVKRHAVKVSYTLCLGGLSFFLFILLTVTGIFLMFFYRPTDVNAWSDIKTLETAVTFGSLVRNMHRWGAHLMVLSVFLHMSRVFYHGAYKPPREFNWVVGVMLLQFTLLLSFTGYLLPWDQLALWAVTVGTNMMGYTPVFGSQVRFVLLGTKEIGTRRCSGGTRSTCSYFRSSSSSSWPSTSGGSGRTAASQGRSRPRGERDMPGEVPEHLLARSRERRKALGLPVPGEDDEGRTPAAAEGAPPAEAPAAEAPAEARRRSSGRGRGHRPGVPSDRRRRLQDPGSPAGPFRRPPGGQGRRGRPGPGRRRCGARSGRRRPRPRPPPPLRRPPPPPGRGAIPSGSSPSSRPVRSSRPGPRPRTRFTPGRTCWSASSWRCSR